MSTATPAAAPPKARPPKRGTFRINFLIEGVAYSVFPLKPDPAVATKAYKLTSRDAKGKVTSDYDVSLSPEGHISCECKGFLRWRKPCKHIRCLAAAGMLPPEVLKPKAAAQVVNPVPQSPTTEPERVIGGDADAALDSLRRQDASEAA
jgi:hypothetical protein